MPAQLMRLRAEERIREEQQGLGRPIVAAKLGEFQMVAVRDQVLWSKKWQSMPDFLSDYIRRVLGTDWGNAELAKPLTERHVVLQWYDELCRYQAEEITEPGRLTTSTVNGVVGCYLGLAYSLYLLDHNVELQSRLVARLKDARQFQGAYYELLVANALIRAGFELTLEDETDPASKHCEFAAVSKATKKKYWVEAKMRSVAGLLGKTALDGGADQRPLSKLVPHLNQALAKPATDDRLIFIDVNAPGEQGVRPDWANKAGSRLERFEKSEMSAGQTAYVFVTNFPFHRSLRGPLVTQVMPFGLGYADFFNRPGSLRLSEYYRRKRKHADATSVAEALAKYPRIPSTFDGRLPSETFDGLERTRIGDRLRLADSLSGVVVTATVDERAQAATLCVQGDDGRTHFVREPMREAQLADYRAHPTTYFGQVTRKQTQVTNAYEYFERLMEFLETWSREQLIARARRMPSLPDADALPTDELRIELCERLVQAARGAGFNLDSDIPLNNLVTPL